MGCQKVIVTTPCGHDLKICYAYCGGYHVNSKDANIACYETTKPIFEFGLKKYVVGSQYCSRECKAFALGWRCCSCNSRHVRGYVDPSTNIVVHKTRKSIQHALCTTCHV